ncbi:hypothetical protein [Kitasatospora sp. NPDC059327]|uniref:hypothetical protein n=1 Tax=Kitasatospora sp. NPDC059327 TaxID=3346803 RepID=UPI00368502AD
MSTAAHSAGAMPSWICSWAAARRRRGGGEAAAGPLPAGLAGLGEGESVAVLGEPAPVQQLVEDQVEVDGGDDADGVRAQLVGQGGARPAAGGAGDVVEAPPVGLGEPLLGEFAPDPGEDEPGGGIAPVADRLGGEPGLGAVTQVNGHGGWTSGGRARTTPSR